MDALEKALFETLMAVMDSVWSEQVASAKVVDTDAKSVEIPCIS